jgi:ABC-type Fe3+/spermidine/putrescine transport system ATPase subunit
VVALTVQGVQKRFADGPPVLNGLDLEVADGEFFTLLGPSGCGKTTLLRCIAGFLQPDAGSIAMDGQRIDPVPAHRRDIGMVFQDYAIFPHLTVAENVAFGLKARRLDRDEIGRRVPEALRMVRLEALAGRLPAELSGGQQQRVGLARAMVIRPKLLLMDEPLSNLDAKLRLELRDDIRDIQRRLGITTIYVTHDQEEAMAVSDRICVMNAGRIEQVATPFELYHRPATRFVAGFVGAMNFLSGQVAEAMLTVGPARCRAEGAPSGAVEVAIRPQEVVLGQATEPGLRLSAILRKVTFLGHEIHCVLDSEAGRLAYHTRTSSPDLLGREGRAVEACCPLAHMTLFGADGRRISAELAA